MHFPVLIVSQRILLQTFGHHVIGDDNRFLCVRFHYKFKYIEQFTGVSAGEAQHGCRFFEFDFPFFQYGVGSDGTLQKFEQIFLFQRFKHIKLATGEERADHFE